MYTQQRARHFHGENHRRRFNHVQNLRLQEEEKLEHGKRVQFALSLEPRIDQLGLKRWRDTVRQSLYRYITKGGDYDNLSDLSSLRNRLDVHAATCQTFPWRESSQTFQPCSKS
jgi:hypothetical protein